jgi:tetratricopeptide (TPR) repeat protein
MSSFFHNHTHDLSAPMMNSSVSSNLSDVETITENFDHRDIGMMIEDGKGCKEVDEGIITLITNLFHKGQYTTLIDVANEILTDAPGSIFVNNAIAESYAKLGDDRQAINYYEKASDLIPLTKDFKQNKHYLPNIYNNLGVALKSLGFLDKSETIFKQAISLDPKSSAAYNNYGNLLNDKADVSSAQKCFLKAIDLDPNNFSAYWNLHSTVNDFDQAKQIIELCLERAPEHSEAIFTLAGINAFAGKDSHFDVLMKTEYSNNPILTSIKWILSLPALPEIHFNRWSVFDRAIQLSNTDRSFYEFGVWMGDSFRYVMQSFKSGYGFDTFKGLPESWGPIPKGTYSSYGAIPDVSGGEFIVGEFEKTLPEFFSISRPKAGLINFDADLYTSTYCALMNAKPVIDTSTIMIFDEFIVNQNWEQDEFKALNDFCEIKGISYEVLIISLFTKQAVVRLSSNK